MVRARSLAIFAAVVSLAAGGCGRCGGGGGADAGPRRSAPSSRPDVPLTRLPLGPEPPLPFTRGSTRGSQLTPEPLATRIAALQGTLVSLDIDQDLEGPLRGAVLSVPEADKGFVLHQAWSAAPLGSAWILVLANTGVWLHEADTLARRARLVAPPVAVMDASSDGKMFAYVTESATYMLHIASFPDLAILKTVPGLDPPHRVRFSPDGRRVVIASSKRNTVTTVDVGTGDVSRYDTGDDVNDAIAMPDSATEVAYVGDSDDAFVYDMAARKRLFTSAPLYAPYRGYMTRDQNAVAHDPVTGDLFSGGDDNKVWRFTGYRTATPTGVPLGDYSGNVEEIVCCRGSSLIVGLDTLDVLVVKRDGAIEASLGPSGFNGSDKQIRLALMPDQRVLGALDGRLFAWNPADSLSLLSTEYQRPERWMASYGRDDTVLFACRTESDKGEKDDQDDQDDQHDPSVQRCSVHRAAHVAAADVEAARIGAVDYHGTPAIFDFDDQTRLMVGGGPNKHLRIAVVAPGGAFQAPFDTPALWPGALETRDDKRSVAFLEASGKLFEIVPNPPWIEEIGRAPAPGKIARIEWKAKEKQWLLVAEDGKETAIAGRP